MSVNWLIKRWRRFSRTTHKSSAALLVARPRVEALEKRELLDGATGRLFWPKVPIPGAPPPRFDQTPFITGLYFDILQRQPQSAEVAGWNAALNAGASRGQVINGFLGRNSSISRMPSTAMTAKAGWSRTIRTTLFQSQGERPSTQARKACWLD